MESARAKVGKVVPRQKPGRSKQDYCTPTEFIKAVHRKLGIGSFIIDLAADSSNSCAAVYYDEATNSLAQDWTTIEGWAWLNPPFADIEPWVRKAYESMFTKIAVLVPASVGSNWWRDWVHEKAEVLFLNGRLAFMRDKPRDLYPKDCALLLYPLGSTKSYKVWSWKV